MTSSASNCKAPLEAPFYLHWTGYVFSDAIVRQRWYSRGCRLNLPFIDRSGLSFARRSWWRTR